MKILTKDLPQQVLAAVESFRKANIDTNKNVIVPVREEEENLTAIAAGAYLEHLGAPVNFDLDAPRRIRDSVLAFTARYPEDEILRDIEALAKSANFNFALLVFGANEYKVVTK